jgi:flagellum-specific ATP synthase
MASLLYRHLYDHEPKKFTSSLKEPLSAYESVEDLVNLGLYTKGTNPVADRVIKHEKLIKDFLRQDYTTPADFESSVSSLMELYRKLTQE